MVSDYGGQTRGDWESPMFAVININVITHKYSQPSISEGFDTRPRPKHKKVKLWGWC